MLKNNDDLVVLLLYVDEMLITRNQSTLSKNFLCQLKEEFAMKDLGHTHYFLSIQIEAAESGLFSFSVKICHEGSSKCRSSRLQASFYTKGK